MNLTKRINDHYFRRHV